MENWMPQQPSSSSVPPSGHCLPWGQWLSSPDSTDEFACFKALSEQKDRAGLLLHHIRAPFTVTFASSTHLIARGLSFAHVHSNVHNNVHLNHQIDHWWSFGSFPFPGYYVWYPVNSLIVISWWVYVCICGNTHEYICWGMEWAYATRIFEEEKQRWKISLREKNHLSRSFMGHGKIEECALWES